MPDARARAMRKALTSEEVRLWSHLKRLRAQGHHFRRQVPFRGYYLDFADHRARLVVELDGDHHGLPRERAHDQRRDALLSAEGYRVLRFWNSELRSNFNGVLDTILTAVADHRRHR